LNLTSSADSRIHGAVNCPGDKSISQRALMVGALINQNMTINGFLHGSDPLSTMGALNQIGAEITIADNNLIQLKRRSFAFKESLMPLNLGNSGTGLRLMLGLASGLGLNLEFSGDSSLSQRPMGRVIDPLSQMGASIQSEEGMLPISIKHSLLKDNFSYELPVASAQVKSSILLAGLAAGVSVKVIEPIQTRDHTERMLKYFGADIEIISENSKNIIELSSGSKLKPLNYKVVGRYFVCSFFDCRSINHSITRAKNL